MKGVQAEYTSNKALREFERIKRSLEKKAGSHAKSSDVHALRTGAAFLKGMKSCHDQWTKDINKLNMRIEVIDQQELELVGKYHQTVTPSVWPALGSKIWLRWPCTGDVGQARVEKWHCVLRCTVEMVLLVFLAVKPVFLV